LEELLTVCIAGIHEGDKGICIVTASDKRVSMFGGWFSGDDMAMKITPIHDDWTVMISGELSPMVPIVDAIREKLATIKSVALRPFATACSEAYRGERQHIIENEILVDHEIDTYAEFRSLRATNKELFDTITSEIQKREEGWSLLFAGFDKNKEPHLFVISERGKIQYCDSIGFAAIGSGQWRALVELSSYEFNRYMDMTETLYGILSAKYSAESADGVGDKTTIAFLRAGVKEIEQFPEEEEFDLKYNCWKGRPKVPKDAELNLKIGLRKIGKFFRQPED
jgi:20S proteasome alpha/beta subunit